MRATVWFFFAMALCVACAGCGNARYAKIVFHRPAVYPTDGVRIIAIADFQRVGMPEADEFARCLRDALREAFAKSGDVRVVVAPDLEQAVSVYGAQLVVSGECAAEITRSPLLGDNRFSCAMSALLSGVRVVGAPMEHGRGWPWFQETYMRSAVIYSADVPDTLDREGPFQETCASIADDLVKKMARTPEERVVYFSQGDTRAIDFLRAGEYLQCYDLLKEKQGKERLPAEDFYLLGVACEAIGTFESLQRAREFYLVAVHEHPWEKRYAQALARLELGAAIAGARGADAAEELRRRLSPVCVPLKENCRVALCRVECVSSEWDGAYRAEADWSDLACQTMPRAQCERLLRIAMANEIAQNMPFQLCRDASLEAVSPEKVDAVDWRAKVRDCGADVVLAGAFYVQGDTVADERSRTVASVCALCMNLVLYDAETLERIREFSFVCEVRDDQCAPAAAMVHDVLQQAQREVARRLQLHYEDFSFRLARQVDAVAEALLGAGLWDAAEKRLLWANRQRQSLGLNAQGDPEGEAALAFAMGVLNEGRGAHCYPEALAFYRTAYELQPDHDEYLEALGRVEQMIEHLGVLHELRSGEEQR